ncbi:MAG: thioredoxin family protein [Planctomycetes bacterium]|nr:thioredoxin family protein [Planctomycetota bacterium]
MRSLALLPLLAVLLLRPDPALAQDGGKVDWTKVGRAGTEYKEALKDAKAKKTPIMIFFTCGCKPCKRFGAGPLSDPKVVETSKKFIRLFIMGNKDLSDKYEIEECPTVVFIDATGAVLKTVAREEVIGISAEDLKKRMDEVLKPPGKKAPGK